MCRCGGSSRCPTRRSASPTRCPGKIGLCMYISICFYIERERCMYVCVYIYIERERDVCIYIYIYIY